MAESKVEIVRAALEAWNEGDWDGVFRYAWPDVELDNSNVQGDYRGVHLGADEARRMWARFVEPWESVSLEIEDLVENGDRVFTQVRGSYVGRDGIEVTAVTGMCWTFREDRISRVLMPNEVDEAREAAGLPLP
jgi:ketosteroid isomerase-like protein